MAYHPPQNYQPLTPASLVTHLSTIPSVTALLKDDPTSWQAEEVGDGNLNLVFIVRSAQHSLIAKQALPYVRLVGESWPLPLSRAYFEHEALKRQGDVAADYVPQIIAYDHEMALIVMEHLTPHIILRKGLIKGIRFPHLARHAGAFMAATLFDYSDLKLDGEAKKQALALFAENHVMCGLTEQVIFDDPYFDAELNRHTSPQLDDIAVDIKQDTVLKAAAQALKTLFMTKAQTLLHGDLHSGSVMVTTDETRVIDPEFAFYGPMGFDIGALMGNFLLAYFSQEGHETQPGERSDYAEWILQTLLETIAEFEHQFAQKWRNERQGSLYPDQLFAPHDKAACEQVLSHYLRDIIEDAIGFAGAKMIRRILGIAHVEDFEEISDPMRRAACERKALELGRIMMVNRVQLGDFKSVVRMARAIKGE